MQICMRHKILGGLPWNNRWHLHFTKDPHNLQQTDYDLFFDLKEWAEEKRFWSVQTGCHDDN